MNYSFLRFTSIVIVGIAMFLMPSWCSAQRKTGEVSDSKLDTSLRLRNILLEEFTASHCSYCPQAHAIALGLQDILGHRLSTIAVHVGSLAEPSGEEPDLRSDYGESWYQAQGEGGMPSGAINRILFDSVGTGNYVLNRGDWAEAVRCLWKDTALVNLLVSTRYDSVSRVLSVDVDYYFQEAVHEPVSLTVALTQNYIRGNQTGGGAGSSYIHRHVLRDLMTSSFGVPLDMVEPGKIYRKSFQKVIPAQYRNVPVQIAHMEVVAFISREAGEVLNTTSCSLASLGDAYGPDVHIATPSLTKYFAYDSIPIVIENMGTDTLRSIKLLLEWDGEELVLQRDDLLLPYGWRREYGFYIGEYDFPQVLKYVIHIEEANAHPVDESRISSYIFSPEEISSGVIRIKLSTDDHPEDIVWRVRDRNGNLVCGGGPYEKEISLQVDTMVELDRDKIYTFEIVDLFKDGFVGQYSVSDLSGEVLSSSDWGGAELERVTFISLDSGSDTYSEINAPLGKPSMDIEILNNPIHHGHSIDFIVCGIDNTNVVGAEIFDLQGRRVYWAYNVNVLENQVFRLSDISLKTGLYILSVSAGHHIALSRFICL